MYVCWFLLFGNQSLMDSCSQAPGEAEAELALLNQLGCIRWIVSDNVDTFLFGGLRVIRK